MEEQYSEMPLLPSKLKLFDKSNSGEKVQPSIDPKGVFVSKTALFEVLDGFRSFQMTLLPELTMGHFRQLETAHTTDDNAGIRYC